LLYAQEKALKIRLKYKCQRAYKPGSVLTEIRGNHSSGTMITHRLARPTRITALKLAIRHPYLVLLRMGFTLAAPVALCAVRSYRTFSPWPRMRGRLFLWHFPSARAGRTLSGILL